MSATSVLLVHGLGSTYENNWRRPGWVDVLEAEGLTPRPVRLPGHGGAPLGSPADRENGPAAAATGHDASGVPVSDAAADAVLSAAGDEPGGTAAVGFSAGAVALLAAATAAPDRFSRIVLLGIGDHVVADDGRPPARDAVRPLVAALRGPAEPTDVRDRTFWRLVGRSGNDRHQVAAFLESARLGVDAGRLARVRCPVLVVVGDRDEAMPADGLVAALPDARLAVLRGVDHFATVSAPAAFEVVTHFLAA